MAIRKTGSRKIVVDGESYLWRVSQKPTMPDADGIVRAAVAIQDFRGTGATLIAHVTRPPPDDGNWLLPLLPSEVAVVIRQAILSGWQPRLKGKQFKLDVTVSISATEENES